MSCEHEVRFTIKPTDDACRFHFDVRAYKDRIVTPDEYSGATVVTPSHIEQVLPTTDKLVRDDITINPTPTEILSTDHNGTFVPSDGRVGFSQVNVDVNPDLRPLSVNENGQYSPDGFDGYSSVTADIEPNLETLSVTENGLYLPDTGVDGFDRVNVDVPVPSGSTTITENGTYDVSSYASAVVDVPDQYLIAEGVEPEEKNEQNGGFCAYWTNKYLSDRDETQYIYVMQFYNNPHPNGVQTLIYGAREDNTVIMVRFNPLRVLPSIDTDDTSKFYLFASAGTIVKVYRIPKTTS